MSAWRGIRRATGKTSVRASYGKSYEFVNGQFHLNTSVAPPWGSEVRLNAPPGGLDNPFLGSPGGQTNIFPVTFDQNAPFSLNGPFLSLTNDLVATNVHSFNVTVERQLAARWFASAGYVGSRTNNIWESTPLNNALFIPVPGTGAAPSIANTNNRRPLNADRSQQRQVLRAAGPVRERRQPALQRPVAVGPRRHPAGDDERELHAVATATGRPMARRRVTTNVSVGYNIPDNPELRRRQLRGGPSAQLLDDRQHPVAAAQQRGDARRVL